MKKRSLLFRNITCVIVTLLFALVTILCFTLNTSSGTSGDLYYIFSYVVVFLFTLYYSFIIYRIEEKTTKVIVIAILGLAIFFLVCEYLKILSTGVVFPRYCEYLYFLPILIIPHLLFILCNEIFSKTSKNKIVLYSILGCISSIFLILILTNDLHNLFYIIPEHISGKEIIYPKNILFYVVCSYSLILCIISISLFVVKTLKRNTLLQLLNPFLVLIVMVVYSLICIVSYKKISNIIFLSDVPLVYNILFSILFESLMRNGLIQNNGQYLMYFDNCKLPLKIVSNSGEDVYVSSLFDNDAYEKNNSDDLVFSKNAINGGYAVIEDDVSEINQLHRELNVIIDELRRNNEILLKRKSIDEEHARIKTRNELFAEIERAIEKKSNEIRFLVSVLPDEINDDNRMYAIDVLGKIRLRIGYLKQKCLLILQTKLNELILNSEFRITANVICSDIKNVGFDSFEYVIKGNRNVPIEFALVFNELMEYLGEYFSAKKCSVLVLINTDELKCKINVEVPDEFIKTIIVENCVKNIGYVFEMKKNDNEFELSLRREN